MQSFLSKFAGVVRGVLSGFDRLFFRGSLRNIAFHDGMQNYLYANRILYKNFGRHSQEVTARVLDASLRQAHELGREVRYLPSAQVRKEDIAREIAARDHIKEGLICVLRSTDPCLSVQVYYNHATRKLDLRYRQRKCLHLYHYQIHPIFGFMHARIQTWFPFTVYVCLNGREWLARQMDQAGLHYCKRKNTFTWVEDLGQAQSLLEQQLQAHWPQLLDGLAQSLNPVHQEIFAQYPSRYYWSVQDSEWASDVMFCSRAAVEQTYPQLVRYAVNTFGTVELLRFLGQPVTASGKVPHRCRHEVITNLTERVEGTRLKHYLNGNSLKIYDKGSVLRTECTLRQPGDFKVQRPAEGDRAGSEQLRPLRKGIADLQRRAAVCQVINERYLEALAAVHDATPLRQVAEPLCQPVIVSAAGPETAVTGAMPTPGQAAVPAAAATAPAASVRTRRVRALNLLAVGDATLLEAVSRPEFLINGLRNRDLRRQLYGVMDTGIKAEDRRRAAAVTRQLRLLRLHGLIERVPQTHRYLVRPLGRQAITALLAARNASTQLLTQAAA
jgi:hypothetical protein